MIIILIWLAAVIATAIVLNVAPKGSRIKLIFKNLLPVVVAASFIIAMAFVVNHSVSQPYLEKLDAERAHICNMMEAVSDGGYENVSAIEVGNMVLDWNDRCFTRRYWANNPWTSWFCSKRELEHLIPIGATPMFNMYGE